MSRILKFYQTEVDEQNKVIINQQHEAPVNEYFAEAPLTSKPLTREEAIARDNDPAKKNKQANSSAQVYNDLVQKAKAEAEMAIATAHVKANQIVTEAEQLARQKSSEIEEAARLAGYEEGISLGQREGERLQREAQEARDNAVFDREQMLGKVEGEVVEFVVSLVGKLLANAIEIKPDIVALLVKASLYNMHVSGEVTIRIAPEDYEAVFAIKDDIVAIGGSNTHFEFMKDSGLKEAECIIETQLGSVDVSIDSSFEGLKEAMTYLYSQSTLVV